METTVITNKAHNDRPITEPAKSTEPVVESADRLTILLQEQRRCIERILQILG